MSDLQSELKAYQKLLPTLMKDEGKFVVLFGDELVGIYEAYADALDAGYQKAGLKPFLVKKILGTETVSYFSRDFDAAPCTTPV